MTNIIPLVQVTERKHGYSHLMLSGTCSEHVTDEAIRHFAGQWSSWEGFPFGTRDWHRSPDRKTWKLTIHTD